MYLPNRLYPQHAAISSRSILPRLDSDVVISLVARPHIVNDSPSPYVRIAVKYSLSSSIYIVVILWRFTNPNFSLYIMALASWFKMFVCSSVQFPLLRFDKSSRSGVILFLYDGMNRDAKFSLPRRACSSFLDLGSVLPNNFLIALPPN